jgi:hypothetical protein
VGGKKVDGYEEKKRKEHRYNLYSAAGNLTPGCLPIFGFLRAKSQAVLCTRHPMNLALYFGVKWSSKKPTNSSEDR